MIQIITQLFKYAMALLMAIYTIRCFTVFHAKTEKKQHRLYMGQNLILFWIHAMLNVILYLNTQSLYLIVFYFAQLCFLIVALFLYSTIYKEASKLLINNMFFLMMLGFSLLARLDMSLAVKQFVIAVLAVALSLVVPIVIAKVGFLAKMGIVYGVIGLAMISSVFVFGTTVYGATNWVYIAGVGFQPSELAKIVFVFFAAAMLYQKRSLERVLVTSAVAAVFVLLLVAEKDLGAALIFFVTYIVILYVSTGQIRWPLMGFGGMSVAAVGAYYLFDHVKRRVVAWLDPWSDYEDAGYQIAQSLFAIGTGGWFGMGFYQGSPTDIPVVQSDFIFSVVAEELGGLFAICLILVYISCFIMFINISLQLTNNFYKLLAIGLSISYGFQLFLCVGGVIKFIPHTGVTMPLVSYGGSSILSTIIVFAVIQGLYLLKQKEGRQLEEKRRWQSIGQ